MPTPPRPPVSSVWSRRVGPGRRPSGPRDRGHVGTTDVGGVNSSSKPWPETDGGVTVETAPSAMTAAKDNYKPRLRSTPPEYACRWSPGRGGCTVEKKEPSVCRGPPFQSPGPCPFHSVKGPHPSREGCPTNDVGLSHLRSSDPSGGSGRLSGLRRQVHTGRPSIPVVPTLRRKVPRLLK